MTILHCPACYFSRTYCRSCKNYHCGCSWSGCAAWKARQRLFDVPNYVEVRKRVDEAGQWGLWTRVWNKVRLVETTGCIEWIGALSQKRRGKRPVVQVGGRGTPVVIVARLVCEWFWGPPPTPLHEAGHTCPKGENARCVHPLHLAWQTRAENEAHKRTYGTAIADTEDTPTRRTHRMSRPNLTDIFTYHRPFGDQAARYAGIRFQALQFVQYVVGSTPPSREQSLAITAIQEAVMWANAAIAINEKEPAVADAPQPPAAEPAAEQKEND